eukprot:TRINITY_DN3637_c0_g1_i7.p1 TRINITY_DN3637_c0_g1~~TRINITY_DN3637_c0_g1_i7.p1  ORF type:complete len:285 (+),score=61.27 TRINITY_DN3637_c0_g1_i7:56-856(+)
MCIRDSLKSYHVAPRKELSVFQTGFYFDITFIHYFYMAFCAIAPGFYFAFNYKEYGIYRFNDDSYMTTVGSVSFFLNGISRLIWGILYDCMSFKTLKYIMLSSQLMVSVSIYFLESKFMYMIWICIILMTEGGVFVVYPAHMLKLYGVKYGTKLVPYLGLFSQFSLLLNYLINGFFLEKMGYSSLFIFLLGGINLVAFMLVCFFNEDETIDLTHLEEKAANRAISMSQMDRPAIMPFAKNSKVQRSYAFAQMGESLENLYSFKYIL